MEIFLNRTFKLWAYTVSHNILILRSEMKFFDQEGFKEEFKYNVDIEFSGVVFMELITTKLTNIQINDVSNRAPQRFKSIVIDSETKIFEIIGDGSIYYVIANNYIIGKNTWISEDRIFNMSLEYDEIIYPNK